VNYLDTSALVKRFVEEAGSDRVDALVAGGEPVATARVAYAEAHAAFARRWRERSIGERDFLRLRRDFDRDWRGWLRLDVTEEILRRVRDLVRRHPLRGYDAVHLAAALELAGETAAPVVFVTADERLRAAAEAERLAALDLEAWGAP
jgi:predicted nucleic acid-binding protein